MKNLTTFEALIVNQKLLAAADHDVKRNDPTESPENYYQDGELTSAQADALHASRIRLVATLAKKVKELNATLNRNYHRENS